MYFSLISYECEPPHAKFLPIEVKVKDKRKSSLLEGHVPYARKRYHYSLYEREMNYETGEEGTKISNKVKFWNWQAKVQKYEMLYLGSQCTKDISTIYAYWTIQ